MSVVNIFCRLAFLFSIVFVILFLVYLIVMYGNPFLSFPGPSPVRRIYSQHQELMALTLDLTPRGEGIGYSDEKVNLINIDYYLDRTVSIDEARVVWLEAFESLLELVNRGQDLKEELSEWPFTVSNIQVNINFATTREDLELSPKDRSVVGVIQVRDKLIYTTYELGKVALGTLHEETYEQAREIVRGKSGGAP